MDTPIKRRKVVKKLDFENCEITTVKMKQKFRRRLKAKITNEYAECVTESSRSPQNNSPPIHLNASEISPILYRRGSAKKRMSEMHSPVLIAKKICKKRDISENLEELKRDSQCLPSTSSRTAADSSSPILLLKHCGNKKKRTVKVKCEGKDVTGTEIVISEESPDPKRLTQIQLFSSPKPCPEVSIVDDDDDGDKGSTYDCRCNIEEFTPQELSNELKILSFSPDSKAFSDIASQDQSRQEDDALVFRTPEKQETKAEELALDSGRKRKRHKKGGFVAKLINLRQRHASERRIREHTKKITKAEEKWKKTLKVIDSWADGNKLLLKCQELVTEEEVTRVIAGDVFVLLDKDLGNYIWKIKKGTFLRIAPPWQELRVLIVNVILNVTTLELIHEIPGVLVAKREMQKIPISRYKEDDSSLFSALLDLDYNIHFGDIFT